MYQNMFYDIYFQLPLSVLFLYATTSFRGPTAAYFKPNLRLTQHQSWYTIPRRATGKHVPNIYHPSAWMGKMYKEPIFKPNYGLSYGFGKRSGGDSLVPTAYPEMMDFDDYVQEIF
jgi:hypothetical protein